MIKASLEFQPTRSSQTSTKAASDVILLKFISIHEVFADLDRATVDVGRDHRDFNPRGLRRPRRCISEAELIQITISIHEVFADLDL